MNDQQKKIAKYVLIITFVVLIIWSFIDSALENKADQERYTNTSSNSYSSDSYSSSYSSSGSYSSSASDAYNRNKYYYAYNKPKYTKGKENSRARANLDDNAHGYGWENP